MPGDGGRLWSPSAPALAEAQATGLLPDYDKCQAYIADVHSAFRWKLIALPGDTGRPGRPHGIGLGS